MSNLDELQQRVGTWGEETFPNANLHSILSHLCEELIELAGEDRVREALLRAKAKRKDVYYEREESADVFLILLHLAHRQNFSLYEEALRKFSEVRCRTYRHDPQAGYARHVEDEEEKTCIDFACVIPSRVGCNLGHSLDECPYYAKRQE